MVRKRRKKGETPQTPTDTGPDDSAPGQEAVAETVAEDNPGEEAVIETVAGEAPADAAGEDLPEIETVSAVEEAPAVEEVAPEPPVDGMPFGQSPVDIAVPEPVEPDEDDDAPQSRPALGWAMAILVMANALLLVCNTHALTNWANQQSPTPLNAPILQAIQNWQALVTQTGLDRPVAWGQGQWRSLRDARWPGQDGPPPPA